MFPNYSIQPKWKEIPWQRRQNLFAYRQVYRFAQVVFKR